MSIKGFTYRGKLEDVTNDVRVKQEFVTLTPKGPSKMALDVVAAGHYRVGATARVAEAGSTDSRLVLTGHDIKVGDMIRLLSTSNTIDETEIIVRSVVDADTVQLDGVLSDSISTGDTFDILRAVTQRFDSTGAQLTSNGPLQINVDTGSGAVATEVLDDRATPANTVPIPVRLYGATGNINITSEDLNVQLSHSAASPDSVQVGDGTEIMLINASGEATVRDGDAITQLTAINAIDFATQTTLAALNAKIPAALGQTTMAGSLSVTIASDQSAININNISGTISLPTGAATAANQSTANTSLSNIEAIDFATETTLSALNGKFSSLGQKASASSAPMVLSTEQEAILTAIQTAVEIIDNAISGTEMQVDLVDLGGAATEASLSSVDGKLPTALGQQNSAGSLSVVIASDQTKINTSLSIVDFLDSGLVDASSTNITTSGLAVVASLAADVKKILVVDDIGEFMTLRDSTGATIYAYLPLGGGEVDVTIPSGTALDLYSETGASIVAGNIAINFMG